MIFLALLAAAAAQPERSGIPYIPAKALPDFTCIENASFALQMLGNDPANGTSKWAISGMQEFFLGRLTAMDENRDWLGQAQWSANVKGNPRISDNAIKACTERLGRYLFPGTPM